VNAHRLIDALATTERLSTIFSDRAVIQAMLDFEVALARVQARAGLIPSRAADAVAAAADAAAFDAAAIAEGARASATAAIPFISALTERVRSIDADSAAYVHWGATSQDVADTALVVLLSRARPVLAADRARLATALWRLSAAHASSVMLARTLMQPAPPITFGLKAAVWVSATEEGWTRLDAALENAAVVQFGGASGTLAALGDAGPDVGAALARELNLGAGPPWHTSRGRLAAVVTAAGIYAGALGKIARDVVLLSQVEVGEVAAPAGRSSTMPHKQNPSGCVVALAAALRVPGLVAGVLASLAQEHERGAGGWQSEWPAVSGAIETTGAALEAVTHTIEQLQVFPERMRANIAATRGVVFAERAVFLLRPIVGRDAADAIVDAALHESRTTGVTFGAALRANPAAAHALPAGQLERIDVAEEYLGAAETFRRQLLDALRQD
jgi:3-carboxy-cis,cis-muconate cycloisomerase